MNFVKKTNLNTYNTLSNTLDDHINVIDTNGNLVLKIKKKKDSLFNMQNIESIQYFIIISTNFLFILIFFIIIDFNIDITPSILPFKLDISFISILLVKQKTEFLLDLISIVNMLYFKVIEMKRLYKIDIGISEKFFYVDDISSTHVFGYVLLYNGKSNKITVYENLKHTKIPLSNFKSYVITDV